MIKIVVQSIQHHADGEWTGHGFSKHWTTIGTDELCSKMLQDIEVLRKKVKSLMKMDDVLNLTVMGLNDNFDWYWSREEGWQKVQFYCLNCQTI